MMMKQNKLGMILAVLIAMALVLTACGGTASQAPAPAPSSQDAAPSDEAETVSIGILQYMEHAALDAARDGFLEALADGGYKEGVNLNVDLQNAQADQSNLLTMSQRFVNNKVDVALAIATPAAQSIAAQTTEIPILFTAVTDPVDAQLVESNEAPGTNLSGTNDMNPVKEQIDLILKLAPDVKTIGIFFTSSEPNSVIQAKMAAEACEALGIKVVEQTVTSTNDVQQAAQSLVGKCDAIYIPTDNVLASSMAIVGQAATTAKIPVICGESNMVLEGGLATLGINYFNLGYQTGQMALRILSGEDISKMPVESLTNFDFTINGDVAAAIGLEIPAELASYVVHPESN